MDVNEEVARNLELQLSELEMLNAMFPNEGELQLADPGVIADLQDFLTGKVDQSELSKLEYTVHLLVREVKVTVKVVLPPMYPDKPALVTVHSGDLNRSNHHTINEELERFQNQIEPGSLCVGSILEWVQDKLGAHFEAVEKTPTSNLQSAEQMRFRMWIQSHHIYSKNKIKNIEDWAKELDLVGFILPGKPGLVCVEGVEANCQIWWQRVRGMNWQRICCKLEEEDSEKRFSKFENIATIRNGEESNMKSFLNYLDRHSSSHAFKEYFGFDGR